MQGGGAEALVRATRSLGDGALRVAYLVDRLQAVPLPELALALDAICARAEQAEQAPREVLVALVDALNRPEVEDIVQRLREEAAGESLLALERLIRCPAPSARPSDVRRPTRPPDYGKGRPLTLGERKSLARRPDRNMVERLLGDPHPDVIRRVLRNPRVTEDDVLRLAARRPCRPEVQSEIAREPRWMHSARVRLAIVLNPGTPAEIASRVAGLLVRQELRLVAEATQVSPVVRAVCLEHLERRPPVGDGDAEGSAEVH
jgi:hypothetical protein